MSSYMTNPLNEADALKNVNFQLDNTIGWVGSGNYEAALIKAECLVSDLKKLIELKN